MLIFNYLKYLLKFSLNFLNILDAGKVQEIEVCNHLIVSEGGYFAKWMKDGFD